MFLSAHQGYIHLIENTVYEILIVLNIKKFNLFQWCNAEFSASLLQSSASHDFSEIIIICWFAAHETIIIINNVENSCAAYYIFSIRLWIERLQEWHLTYFIC